VTDERVNPRGVLVVDDHAGFRRSARALLELAGLRVVGEAADGAAALAEAARLRPDIVLLDVALPDMDGLEVSARMTSGSGPAPLVVLTSSRDLAGRADLVGACGARVFVRKDRLSLAVLAEVTA
jgi:DNA-binding NarL/FixJ family response regulator